MTREVKMSNGYPRFDYYQTINVWPSRMDDLNYKGWLLNFDEGTDRSLAQLILEFFVYIPEDMVNQLFKTVVGRAGYHFKQQNTAWNNGSFKNNCWYSYIPGEIPNKSDSGGIFARKVRDVLDVDESRILDFKGLIWELQSSSAPQRVILTDDFVGSGNQCVTAWNSDCLLDDVDVALKTVALKGNHQIVYAPLVANKTGVDRIAKDCEGLKLEYIYLLDDEYNLFSPECLCWKGNKQLYDMGMEMIMRKSVEQGIVDSNGTQSVKGYRGQGLAIAFSHGMPDACPAFFYWQNDNWVPLIKKHFKRM